MPRVRLLELLDRGAARPLTLLAAPAGAGKTALLAAWIAADRAPGPVAWLALGAAERDRRSFWRVTAEALERAGVEGPLQPSAAGIDEALAERPQPVVLVLDDFHEAGEAVHPELDRLLRRPPAALRLVVATRADPQVHLGRLRVQDQLTEIRAADLALTVDETDALLAALGLELGDTAVLRLWQRTEGWVAALRLAALSLRNHPEPDRFVEAFAGDDRAVSDYLITEVLAAQTPEDRCFLLRTSIVDVLCGDLADALTDGDGGHRRLAELARSGAPVEALDGRGSWYRIHALFGQLLRAELRSERPADVPELHRRAAEWLAENGDEPGALPHAIDGGAWDVAARLASDSWVEALVGGDTGALDALLARMPRAVVGTEPELAPALAYALLERGEEASATAELARAEAGLAGVPEERRARLALSLAAVRLYLARVRGDLDAGRVAEAELERRAELETPGVEGDVRALATLHLGIAELWAGEADSAARLLERARGAADEAGREWLVMTALAHLGLLAVRVGDYPRAARHARDAIALATRHGWDRTWPAGAAHVALGAAEFLWSRLEDAARTLERAQAALATTRERPLRAMLAIVRAGVLNAQSEPEAALAVLGAGEAQLGSWPLRHEFVEQFVVLEAMLRAELGDREHAHRLIAASAPTLATGVALAGLRLGDGDPAGARDALKPWRAELERGPAPTAVQGWLLEAMASEGLGDGPAAAAALENALERAEPSGLVRGPLSFGRALGPLLRRGERDTAHRALVTALLGALGRSDEPRTMLREPLSPREVAVLRCLPTMMSNEEIAAELYVSVNTVKTHLKAIYRKLDVQGRRDAVRRARALELLAP